VKIENIERPPRQTAGSFIFGALKDDEKGLELFWQCEHLDGLYSDGMMAFG
jgi:hypothetical protein